MGGQISGALSKELCDELLIRARQSLKHFLVNEDYQPQSLELPERGVFVTLRSGQQGDLRGCIGHASARLPVDEAVIQLTRSAATDRRFEPISKEEEEGIHIEVSVLTPMVKVESVEDISVGRDGLMLRSATQSGLLLPKVATDRGWDRERFLTATCEKAGLAPSAWRDTNITVYRFQCQVFCEGSEDG